MNAIPTKYAGVQFRSRLEARWAAFFDLLGWEWEYESLDLNGYIPDFVLKLERPVLIEVKPIVDFSDKAFHSDEICKPIQKIQTSGWKDEAVLVGAALFDDGWCGFESLLGVLTHDRTFDKADDGHRSKQIAVMFKCALCERPTFASGWGGWKCRACGKYDGNCTISNEPAESKRLWRQAGNLVQWRAPK